LLSWEGRREGGEEGRREEGERESRREGGRKEVLYRSPTLTKITYFFDF
jgi:hypothetical protein